jgi:hypothetical protein
MLGIYPIFRDAGNSKKIEILECILGKDLKNYTDMCELGYDTNCIGCRQFRMERSLDVLKRVGLKEPLNKTHNDYVKEDIQMMIDYIKGCGGSLDGLGFGDLYFSAKTTERGMKLLKLIDGMNMEL